MPAAGPLDDLGGERPADVTSDEGLLDVIPRGLVRAGPAEQAAQAGDEAGSAAGDTLLEAGLDLLGVGTTGTGQPG